MKTITIKLTAPLQSYGNEATFTRRTSGDHPSKSAVIGMIAAALGYQRDDPRILALNELYFAVRVDQVGKTLTDYQTVEWKKNTRKITYRDYLQDALFVVAVGSDDDEMISKIRIALQKPKFQLFLGRRANVPAGVLKTAEYADQDPITVLSEMKWQAAPWYQKKRRQQALVPIEIVADANLLKQSVKRTTMVKDRVESFSQRNRRYGFRAVATMRVNLENKHYQENKKEPEHDIMGFL